MMSGVTEHSNQYYINSAHAIQQLFPVLSSLLRLKYSALDFRTKSGARMAGKDA